jgi:uncharacterized SAM-binding protein YcdF (DUF218 family)
VKKTLWPSITVAGIVVLLLGLVLRLPDFFKGGDRPERADVIVALAGGERTLYRLEEALRLVRAGYATNLVVSGVEYDPQSKFFDKPTWALLQQNLGTTRVFVDSQSDYTQKTAAFVKRLAERESWKSVLVVTSEFHWRRTRMLFRYECAPALSVGVVTIKDQPFDRWWRNSYRAWLVFGECRALASFLLVQSYYGVAALAALVLLVTAIALARRLIP